MFERMKSNIIVGQGLAQDDSKESHVLLINLQFFWGYDIMIKNFFMK